MARTWIVASAAVLLCPIAVSAAETPQHGGTAVFVVAQDPTNLNPAISNNLIDREIGCMVSDGLVRVSIDYKVVPLLAKSWSVSPDGLTYSFELNKAQWHDGKPFTSDDVKYSLIEVSSKYSSVFAPAGKTIDTIEAPAPDKVVIHLKQPFGPFLLSLACTQGGAIAPAHLFRGTDPIKNPAALTSPIGTGAFRFAEWQHSDHVRLVKNDKFFIKDRPYLDEVVAKVIPQPAARIQALKAGEVDLVQLFPPNNQAEVKADPNLKIERSDTSPGMTYAFLNNDRKPMDDKRVRQALFMAVDRDYLIKNAFFGLGSVGKMPFTTDIAWAANRQVDFDKMYPYDPAKANALLDTAGLKRGADGKRFPLKLAIYATSYPEFQQVAVALKSMWGAVGVDLTIEALEDATMIQKIYGDRDYEVALNSYSSYSDPALGIARGYVSSMVGKLLGNPSGYKNPEVDKLFAEGERGTTYEQRGPAYQKVQAILAEDMPSLPLRQFTNIDAASKRFHGLWGDVQGNGNWIDAWLSK